MDFSDSLKKLRKEKRLSQQELAKKLSVAQSTVGMWESGKRTPKLDELKRLARALSITVNRLLGTGSAGSAPGAEKRIDVEKDAIYIDGEKVSDLAPNDVDGIVEYINALRQKKGELPRTPPAGMKEGAKKILIIDDEQEACEMLYTFLVPHNYKVFLAFNGQMGLEYFEEIKPDIVFLDLKMPDIDGIEVLKIIRKVSSVPVVIITAYSQDVADIHLADLKIDGYIEKPISLKAVLNTLKFLIGE